MYSGMVCFARSHIPGSVADTRCRGLTAGFSSFSILLFVFFLSFLSVFSHSQKVRVVPFESIMMASHSIAHLPDCIAMCCCIIFVDDVLLAICAVDDAYAYGLAPNLSPAQQFFRLQASSFRAQRCARRIFAYKSSSSGELNILLAGRITFVSRI